jgi:hypothetical protein
MDVGRCSVKAPGCGNSSSPVEGEAARGDVQGTEEVPNPVGAGGYTRAP